jgi:hypothetical protein
MSGLPEDETEDWESQRWILKDVYSYGIASSKPLQTNCASRMSASMISVAKDTMQPLILDNVTDLVGAVTNASHPRSDTIHPNIYYIIQRMHANVYAP